MDHTTDDFSKNLAGGTSRRKAFLKFLGGAGVLGFLGLRKAKAGATISKPIHFPSNPADCVGFCLNYAGGAYVECMEHHGSFSYCFYNVLGSVYDECVIECEHGPEECNPG
jgi:hypothetical protein